MARPTLIASAFLLVAAQTARPEDNPLAALRGTWVCIEQGGATPKREYKLIVDKAGGYRMGGTSGPESDIAMQAGAEGTLKIDASQSPTRIRFVGSRLTVPGIYRIEGTRLTMVLNADGRQPTTFDKPDGVVHVYIREEEKK